MSAKHLDIVTWSGGEAMRTSAAGAEMAINIFKNITEQGCLESATELLLGMVSGGVGILKMTLGPAETLKILDMLAEGLTIEHADAIPYLLVGTVDEIVDKLSTCHARWGISYFVVRELDSFAPVIAALRQ